MTLMKIPTPTLVGNIKSQISTGQNIITTIQRGNVSKDKCTEGGKDLLFLSPHLHTLEIYIIQGYGVRYRNI